MKRIIIRPNEAKELVSRGPLDLDELKELIGAEYIDIIIRKIGGVEYHIVADDMGALKPNVAVAQAIDGTETLYGPIIVTRYEYEGDEVGLDDEDIVNVWAHIFQDAEAAFLVYAWNANF